jgi:hypothetical protein
MILHPAYWAKMALMFAVSSLAPSPITGRPLTVLILINWLDEY